MGRKATEYGTTCANKVGRERAANRLEKALTELGVTVLRTERAPRHINLLAALGPYRCSISFDGTSYVTAFLGHWFIDSYVEQATYSTDFEYKARSNVNAYHRRKATSCNTGFESFLNDVVAGFVVLKG